MSRSRLSSLGSQNSSHNDEPDLVDIKEPALPEINHIKKNIQLSGKINKIIDIQRFNRNYKYTVERRHKVLFQKEHDLLQRTISIEKLDKWQDFRVDRSKLIDKYIKIKKKMYKVNMILNIFYIHLVIQNLSAKYKAQVLYIEREK